MKKDTIVAIATPPGRSAIGIIKMSGGDSLKIARTITEKKEFLPSRATVTNIVNPQTKDVLDRAIVLYFRSPNSQTGEDVVEFHLHGNPVLLQEVLKFLIAAGARIADPGEFTRRAFENGKIDLLQAESVAELVSAKNELWLKRCASVITGKTSQRVRGLRESLLRAISTLETYIEFPEDEDSSRMDVDFVLNAIMEVGECLKSSILSYEKMEKRKKTMRVVIAGPPNSGKSSLFNALLGYERTIISPEPGTTRDYIEEYLDEGTLITIVDTAGLRKEASPVEKAGIERAKELISSADLVLAVIDGTKGIGIEEKMLFELTRNISRFIVINKIDLVSPSYENALKEVKCEGVFETSALRGDGVKELKDSIIKFFSENSSPEGDLILLNLRQKILAEKTLEEINLACESLRKGYADISAEHLRTANENLGRIVGEITVEEVLDEIFSNFCIGK